MAARLPAIRSAHLKNSSTVRPPTSTIGTRANHFVGRAI
jgi:hypothetical protein